MSAADLPVRYRVDLSARRQHLVTVHLTVPEDVAPAALVSLPVWTPGSYVVRDYVRHLQRIVAVDGGGDPLSLTPEGRSAWRLPASSRGPVEVEIELYANQLSVRTNHVDDHHALLVAPATFPCVEGASERPHEVLVELPDGWQVWGLLPARDGVFVAGSYDHLADSAFEAGAHTECRFDVTGVPHRFVWAGHAGRPDLDRITRDAERVGAAAVELFGGDLPVDAYTFLCLAWHEGGGGLEHRDGAVLQVPAASLHETKGYRRFQALLAHEYLHLWNVKRLVPAALSRPHLHAPAHTTSLWVAEGWTSYYDELLLVRAGVWSTRSYLDGHAELIDRVMERPGRRRQSVRQASHEAWTKFYVRDENTPNVGVSYYDHGAVLAWCLDLLIRREHPDGDGLDDVLRLLWRRFGARTPPATGYEESDVEAAASEVAGCDLRGFFAAHVEGVADPPLEDLIDVVGLHLTERTDEDDPPPPDLGVETSEDDDGVTVTSVLRDRPAWSAGLTGGDRLLAVDGTRVRRGDLPNLLRAYREGDEVEVAVFRGPRLVTTSVTLGPPRPPRRLVPVAAPTDAQRGAFERWTGRSLDEAAVTESDGGEREAPT